MPCSLSDALALIVLTLANHEKDGLLVKGNEWVFEGVSWQFISYLSGAEWKSEDSTYTETVRLADVSRSGGTSRITLHDLKSYPIAGTTLVDTVALLLNPRDDKGYILKTSDSIGCEDVDFRSNSLFTKDTLLADLPNGKEPHVAIKSFPISRLQTESEYLPSTGVIASTYRDFISSGGAQNYGYWMYHQGHFKLKEFKGVRGRRRPAPDPAPSGYRPRYDLLGRLRATTPAAGSMFIFRR